MDTFMSAGELIKNNKIMLTNGVIQIVNHDNRQTINTVNNPQSTAISFGDGSTNNVINNYGAEIDDLTSILLEQLKLEAIDADVKSELVELIEGASEESNLEKPKKTLVRTLLNGSKTLMDTITKSPALIEAYEKWATFIQSVV